MLRFFLVGLLSIFMTSMVAANSNEGYRVGPGDILSIIVFGEEDLSLKQARVGTNGVISFPLLGELKVNNFTLKELEGELVTRLKDGYLKKPVVTISVLKYRFYYVNGEVRNPGGYDFLDGLTVQKAITLAGGFTERASKDKISLEREMEPGKTKNVDLNEAVNPGDVITVDESFF